jgi:hypothetical protein
MIRRMVHLLAAAALLAACAPASRAMGSYQDEFGIAQCKLSATGRNEYFILEPGYQLVLEGGGERLQITVLEETKTVAGFDTRVVEEREWNNNKLKEVSRNYFAMCPETRDVFYFGEDVDNYKDGKVANHDGSWLAGVNGNRPGLIMPGAPKRGMKYYQEIAPGVAMDRAEIESLDETCNTPAGTFKRCMKVKEGSAIEFFAKEYKYHAPGIGLVRDEDLQLVRYGFVKAK